MILNYGKIIQTGIDPCIYNCFDLFPVGTTSYSFRQKTQYLSRPVVSQCD